VTVFGQRLERLRYRPLNNDEFQRLEGIFGPVTERYGPLLNDKATARLGPLILSPQFVGLDVGLGPIGVSPLSTLTGALAHASRGRSGNLVPGYHPPRDANEAIFPGVKLPPG